MCFSSSEVQNSTGGSLSSPDGQPDSLLAELLSLMALIGEQITTGLLSVLTSPLFLPPPTHPHTILSSSFSSSHSFRAFCLKLFKVIEFFFFAHPPNVVGRGSKVSDPSLIVKAVVRNLHNE